MELAKALDVRPGVTAIIGGGGKTTLMECLAEELSAQARVIVCTTTHIYPEQNMPCLVSTSEAEIAAELARTRCVCVGSVSESGKYSAPELPFRTLCALASYVIVEADGSKRLPLKAHAPHEPVIPPEANPPRTDRRAGARRKRGDGRNAGALGEIFESGSAAYARSGQSGRERAGAADSKSAGRRTFLPGVHGGITKGVDRMLVLIRGAGDLATGIALRLFRSHLCVVMTDLLQPTAIRRTVCFSQAILYGSYQVEDVTAELAASMEDVRCILAEGCIPVLADPKAECRAWLKPDVVVDAILAKKNLGTQITDAPLVIGVGPGFCAGRDCHAVIETMRGHTLGRVIREGEPIPNTNIPGLIGGFTGERVLRAPDDGMFHQLLDIGAMVQAGDIAGEVNGKPMICTISGVIRGMLADGTPVFKGMKSGDVDPRGEISYCQTASDKAIAIGGGVLQAILEYTGVLNAATGKNALGV